MSLEKQRVAEAALAYVSEDGILGVGTGSTVNCFIECLGRIAPRLEGAVSSSEETTRRLKALGIPVFDLNGVDDVSVYIDGADEFNPDKQLIKGGGGALTREKILAAASQKFVCMVDASKQVDVLGAFPLPVEVIPMARSLVGRRIKALGGAPVYREGVVTDNGNIILDVHHLDIVNVKGLSQALNAIPGVVTHGLFLEETAADVVLMAQGDTVHAF